MKDFNDLQQRGSEVILENQYIKAIDMFEAKFKTRTKKTVTCAFS